MKLEQPVAYSLLSNIIPPVTSKEKYFLTAAVSPSVTLAARGPSVPSVTALSPPVLTPKFPSRQPHMHVAFKNRWNHQSVWNMDSIACAATLNATICKHPEISVRGTAVTALRRVFICLFWGDRSCSFYREKLIKDCHVILLLKSHSDK